MSAPLLVTNAPKTEGLSRGDNTQTNRNTASNRGTSFAEVIEKRLNNRDNVEPKTPKDAPSPDDTASQVDAAGQDQDTDSEVDKSKEKEPSEDAQTSPTGVDGNTGAVDGQTDSAEASPQGQSNQEQPDANGQAAQPQQIPADGDAVAASISGLRPSAPSGEATQAGNAEVDASAERVGQPLRAATGAETTTGKETGKPGGQTIEKDLGTAQADPKLPAVVSKVEQSLSAIPSHQHTDAGHEAVSAAVRGAQAQGVGGSSPTASALTPPPLAAAELPDGLNNQIRWMINRQNPLAELKLNPAELGSLEVKIAVDKDTTNIHFLVHNAAAKDMVEHALPRLRALLGNVGVNLQEVSVSERSAGEQQQNAQSGFADNRNQGYENGHPQDEPSDVITTSTRAALADRMVDAYA